MNKLNAKIRIVPIFVLTLFTVLQFSYLSPQIVFACSCPGMPYPPEQAFESSRAVFSGTIISKATEGGSSVGNGYAVFPHSRVQIQVLESWKGIDSNTVTITTGISDDTCGFDFQEGEKYLIYAHDDTQYGTEFTTGLCQRTKLLANAQEDLAFLDASTVPSIQGKGDLNNTEQNNHTSGIVFVSSVVGVTFLLALYFLGFKKKRKTRH